MTINDKTELVFIILLIFLVSFFINFITYRTIARTDLDWEVSAFWVESVFVSDVVDGVLLAGGWVDEGVASTDDQEGVFAASVSKFSGFLSALTVGQFIAKTVSTNSDIVMESFLQQNNFLLVLSKLRCSSRDGYASSKNDELKCHTTFLVNLSKSIFIII